MRKSYAAVLVLAFVSCAQAQSIYKQEVFAGEGFSSTYDPTAVFAFLAADNFTIASPATVGQVRWWGNSDEFGSPDLTNFTEFTVTLHQRTAAGLPGAIIYQEEFTTAATNPVDTGLVSANNTNVWRQTVSLATPQALAAGSYYLSVGVSGYVDNQGAIWFWNTSLQGDRSIAFDAYDGQGWRPFTTPPTDLSFELIAVPEPACAGVLMLGCMLGLRCARGGRVRAARPCSRPREESTANPDWISKMSNHV